MGVARHAVGVGDEHAGGVGRDATRGERGGSLRLEACRPWLPENNTTWRDLVPQPWISDCLGRFPADGLIPANDRGGARVAIGLLPLTYAALEVRLADDAGKPVTVWAHPRIKREVFDINGGWVASGLGGSNTLHAEHYLKTLHRMHINAGMHQHVPGYSDTPLYGKYPRKYMNRLQPFDQYDTDLLRSACGDSTPASPITRTTTPTALPHRRPMLGGFTTAGLWVRSLFFNKTAPIPTA
jgi:hypothetical protein